MCALKAGEAKGIGRVGLEKLLVPQDVPYHPDLPEAMRTQYNELPSTSHLGSPTGNCFFHWLSLSICIPIHILSHIICKDIYNYSYSFFFLNHWRISAEIIKPKYFKV